MIKPHIGSLTELVRYDHAYTAHLLAYDEATKQLRAAIDAMSGNDRLDDWEFKAMGFRYRVTRQGWQEFLVTRTRKHPDEP